MWFRLAKELGRTVAELQASMSSAEFGEWIAYYSIEPFGDRMQDVRMGTIASTIANVNRSSKTSPYKPIDFFPWAKEPEPAPKPETAHDKAATLFGINLAELKKSGKRTVVIKRKKSG